MSLLTIRLMQFRKSMQDDPLGGVPGACTNTVLTTPPKVKCAVSISRWGWGETT